MLKPKMEDALNDQIVAEFYSAYLYLSMSAYFEGLNLSGMAHWMRIQTQEEVAHAMKFFAYILERGGSAKLGAIDAPDAEWDSPLAVFQQAYDHEVGVSERIDKLVDVAIAESDHATNQVLQWFVAEQVEEEASADEVVQRLKLIGDSGNGLLLMDQELAQRPVPVFPPPPTGE